MRVDEYLFVKKVGRLGVLFATMVAAICLAGCAVKQGSGTSTGPTTPPTTPPTATPSGPYVFLSGNWEFTPSSTKGPVPFTLLAGYLDEFNNSVGVSDFATAALQVRSTTCYTDQTTIPLTGGVTPSHAVFQSFPIDLQVLDLSGNKNTQVTQLAGSYTIAGGCGDGASGNLTGQLYNQLMGQYTGALTNSTTTSIQLSLTQDAKGTSDGRSFVTGSAVFHGFSCFSTGTLVAPNGWVLGSSLSLTFNTNEATGSTVVLTGSFDPAADTLSISSASVTGGGCAGSLGMATLSH